MLRWLRALALSSPALLLVVACATSTGQAECLADDEPDPLGVDSDCDGVDGVAADAIFVATNGDDGAPGTREAPLKTIKAALDRASREKKRAVFAGGGTYDEPATLLLPDKVGLYGGYDPGAQWKRTGERTKIVVRAPVAMEARGLSGPNVLARFTLTAADGTKPGESSIALRLVDVKGAVLTDDVELVAGRGAPGTAGTPGMAGAAGNPGAAGGNGAIDNQNSPGGGGPPGDNPACPEARGGAGGQGGKDPNFAGVKGEPSALMVMGGLGGATNSCSPSDGQPGQTAPADGEPGADGAAGGAPKIDLKTYSIAPPDGADGQPGKTGAGGGGGGGSSGQTSISCIDGSGNGGGGGGAGGCGGTGGTKGTGGGSSVALLAVASPVKLDGVTLSTAGGGKGGDGGAGGVGGAGAQGGPQNTFGSGEIGKSGKGGDGRKGGAGGGGGGGASIGVWFEGQVGTLDRVTYKLGEPGEGGACPKGPACSGARGPKKEVGP
jgi:hypothetical protein